jgi:DNA-binding NtrC family response regulator
VQTTPVPVLPTASRSRTRTALVASADASFRRRVSEVLTGLRWRVREADGGAQVWGEASLAAPEAVVVDSWLPDLDLGEFLKDFRSSFPEVDIVTAGGASTHESPRGPHRQELLLALRRVDETDTAAWNSAPELAEPGAASRRSPQAIRPVAALPQLLPHKDESTPQRSLHAMNSVPPPNNPLSTPGSSTTRTRVLSPSERLPELIGEAQCMLELSRRIRLVAPRSTPVLIEGPTGSGKELVAAALHRLSSRSRKPFVAINCAAIPEALLEAELFGHTRGAFTGAVQGRVGRIEAADGGTLFLDEIGEMPLALQSKLLRFVESGELQRVGDNETAKVDVRILAATHQPLSRHAQDGKFRADLYYRLAVFLIRTPALADHIEDLSSLVDHFLERMGREQPAKRIDAGARAKLNAHAWPGNVRELEHVIERAVILAGEEPVVSADEIDFGVTVH